jgi:GNAT superfamily N-acetyltransferase
VPLDRNGVPFPPVRRLGPDDLRHCMHLAVDRGWLPEKAKWSLLLEVSEVFGVDAPDSGDGGDGGDGGGAGDDGGAGDGALAGAVVLTRYGAELASVGMMLVAARHGRRGLGRALMEHLLAEAGDATVTLVATDLGEPLYDKLGFRTIRRSAAFTGRFRAAPAAGTGTDSRTADNSKMRTRPATTTADMASIIDVDKSAFGADRSHLLRRLPAFAEQLLVLETEHGITGFAAAWPNHTSTVIGPVVAPGGAAARRLISDLAAGIRGQVRLDLDPDRPELPAWAVRHGLRPAALNPVMAHGDRNPPGDPGRLFAPISIALA